MKKIEEMSGMELNEFLQFLNKLENPEEILNGKLDLLMAQMQKKQSTESILYTFSTCKNFKRKIEPEYTKYIQSLESISSYGVHLLLRQGEVTEFADEKGISIEKIAQITEEPIGTLKYLKEYTDYDLTDAEQIINGKVKETVIEMMNGVYDRGFSTDEQIREKQESKYEIVEEILKDILREENEKICNIKKIGRGYYGSAYQIGTKVLKIGEVPKKYKINKWSKRFLEPIMRTNFSIIDSNGKNKKINISCSELVENCDVSDKQLYDIYKELREIGLVWLDAKKENVGKLTKDNLIYYNSGRYDVLHVHGPNVGFPDEEHGKPAKEGELVILDLDFIFDENDKAIKKIKLRDSKSEEFEKIYQKEKILEELKNTRNKVKETEDEEQGDER